LIAKDKKERLIELIALNAVEGVGAIRFYQLMQVFGSVENVFKASLHDLTDINGIGRQLAEKITSEIDLDAARRVCDKISELDWGVFLFDEADYPEPLRTVLDRPPFLFYLGDYNDKDKNAIAVVGSRTASDDGKQFAENLAAGLSGHSVTVVSGMARGIDTAAHLGALHNSGRTIAVFGCSLDIIYPPESRKLAQNIIQSGCLISEHLPNTQPLGANFPKRNRIISGLSQGVVVIEAAEQSGALSTAGHALNQNREVFAVPGSPRKRTSLGTNRLIKEGAVLLTSVEDIFSELPRLKGKVKTQKVKELSNLTESEMKILEHFADGPVHIDHLARSLNTAVADLMQILLALELKGLIKELSGKRYILE
jgi:DNA processing protein